MALPLLVIGALVCLGYLYREFLGGLVIMLMLAGFGLAGIDSCSGQLEG